LENARILYENSDKTAAEVCEIVGVGRRKFFSYIAEKRGASGKNQYLRWNGKIADVIQILNEL
jgi:hypothetical protein